VALEVAGSIPVAHPFCKLKPRSCEVEAPLVRTAGLYLYINGHGSAIGPSKGFSKIGLGPTRVAVLA
jgi:hypothetical protein